MEMWQGLGSTAAAAMFMWAMFQQYFPHDLRRHLEKYLHKLLRLVYPYVQVSIKEYGTDNLGRNEAYAAIETYLAASPSAQQAKRLTAETTRNPTSPLVYAISEHEEVEDLFEGARFWWTCTVVARAQPSISLLNPQPEERRLYQLTFHKNHQELAKARYIPHVLREGKLLQRKHRQRKLYTNNSSYWNHVVFDHPATFSSIAMEAGKKKEIIDDLLAFRGAEDFYARIGKAWKRGYLLHGPPGTGKSTMIAAMANLLDYDIYDLELTSVSDNTQLRKLLIKTSAKSILVIEDIDCSLDLTGQRTGKTKKKDRDGDDKAETIEKATSGDGESKSSKVTLSGLLNIVDGLWSACKGERLVVFTTNFKEKLDPALIRRGRMDKHIHLSYCCFEAFKVLARNYWLLDDHPTFPEIRRLLEETNMTPADAAECLMPKTEARNADDCLECLIQALHEAKAEAKMKAEEEAKKKSEEESAKRRDEEEEAKKTGVEEEAKKKAKEEEEEAKKKSGGAA